MLVGRRRELGLVRRRLRQGASVAVVGDAGIGKSTLLAEAVEAPGRVVHRGGGVAGLAYLPYLALERAIREQVPSADPQAVPRFVQERVAPADLLLLDDLQWAAAATLELLPRLDRQLAVAVRSGDPRCGEALAALAACGIEPIYLEPLGDADSRRLLAAVRSGLPTADVVTLVSAAGGNPLLLCELDVGREPSPTLLVSLRARLEQASATARDWAEVLALLARPVDAGLLPTEAAAELRSIGLVVDEDGRLALRHALLGDGVAETLGDERRREQHERIAAWLPDPGEAARHYLAAGHRERALELALTAAGAAELPEEQAAHLGLAADAAGPGAEADDLRLRAAESLLRVGAFDRAEKVAAAVARGGSERARSLLIQGSAQWALGRADEAERSFARGLRLARGTRTPVEVQLGIARCQPLIFSGRYRQARLAAARAVRLAEEIESCTAQAHLELGSSLYWSGRKAALEEARIALERARLGGDAETELAALQLAAGCRLLLELDSRAALRLLREMARRAAAVKLPGWEMQSRWVLAHCENWALGRYEQVIPTLRQVAAAASFGHTDPDQVFADLAIALADVGAVAEARRILDEKAGDGRAEWGRGVLLVARAELEWLMRRPERTLDAARRFEESVTEPNLATQLCAIRDYARWDLGEPAGPPPPPNPIPMVELSRQECLAIGSLDRADEAERRFLEAAAGWHRVGLRFEVRCLWGAGEAARLAAAEDRARRHLLRAERLALRHGLQPMLGRIRRSLRAVGTRRSIRRVNGAVLTARELAVLRLVGDGLSSREIAARMALSPHTVDSIVKSSMAKLGVTTRLSAAVKAAAAA